MMQFDTHECKILYVDDEPNNLKSFNAAFRRDYEVMTAASAEEGLALFKNNDIQVVVTDQRMPGMTGVQFLQHIPEDLDNVRIILTGYSDVASIIDAINTGKVYRYITKPWDKNELKITLNNALETVMLRRNNKHLIHELLESNQQLEEKVRERTLEIEQQKILVEQEKAKSDALLLNILPEKIADELKLFGKSITKRHDQVTVLFADIENFTSISDHIQPELLVDELDQVFRAFDDIVDANKIEKIKTIGDAYMAACGLPEADSENAKRAVSAAIEMQEYLSKKNRDRKAQNLTCFEFRIGLNTGPVVAGVVGKKKFVYDIWGDTVNMAARMEQNSEIGKVNISQSTHDLVKGHFKLIPRGKVSVKNKGEEEMYFVEVLD